MTVDTQFDDTKARRNAGVLAVAQALFGAATTALVGNAGLIGAQLSPDPSFATLPMSAMIVGTATTTFPISMLMKYVGRRAGFVSFALLGAVGALFGVYAIYQRSFSLFLFACLLMGSYQASASYYRFAAADTASPAFRPKAISWVMTGGVVAAVIGTAIAVLTVDLLAPVTFAGTWVAMALMAFVASLVLLAVDIPLKKEEVADAGRSLFEIARQTRFVVACATGMLSYGIMMLVMTATPVAMLGCGFAVNDSYMVILMHALAMFVPSFFTGNLIARFGAESISAVGMLLLVAAAISGLMGIEFENFAVGLVLLGLGWNFGFLGGTTMLTTTYQPVERNKAQGLNDFLTFAVTAVASLSAGTLLAISGWNAVNYAVFPMVAVALAMIMWLTMGRRAA